MFPDVHISEIAFIPSIPIRVKIPHLFYEPECAVDSFLERGGGTEIMIKTALQYAHKDVPSITIFEFDDDSHIDCIEKNMSTKPPRKSINPLNLAFFSIAYHDMTWYEARFNAKMINAEKYKQYKQSLQFLKDPTKKESFESFLQIIGNSLSSSEKIHILERYYTKASTYREFFENIPKTIRYQLLFGWLNTFMEHYIVFDDKGWYIDVLHMDRPDTFLSGGSSIGSSSRGCSLSRNQQYRIFSHKKISCF